MMVTMTTIPMTRGQRRRPRKKSAGPTEAWRRKLAFLRKFGQHLLKSGSDYSSLFSVGFAANKYTKTHEQVWESLSETEKDEFSYFSDPVAFRNFVNNTKYLFSPQTSSENELAREVLVV